MVMVKKFLPCLILLFLAFYTAEAQQKFGHINSGNLLENMPEVSQADQNLMSYREGLTSDFEARIQRFQQKYQAFSTQVQSGELSQRDQQIKEQELTMEQEELANVEKEIQQKILMKREQLLGPILSKVDEAIKAVGDEGQYAFIFDTSTGAMLYAIDSEDVTEKVKQKLGI